MVNKTEAFFPSSFTAALPYFAKAYFIQKDTEHNGKIDVKTFFVVDVTFM